MASSVGPGSAQLSATMDVMSIFELLESNKPEIVQDVKENIQDTLNSTKESWCVYGLFEYYNQRGSPRCCDILCGITREPHDKYFIEKMTEGLKSPSRDTRRNALTLLGHTVCRQPSWLYKITQFSLFKELIKLLKTETDVVVVLTGLLSIIMMLPIIPISMVGHLQDFFDVFGRLATWTNTTTQNIPKEHLLHLQVGLYSLFHRLYAMFPCNFLSYLRHSFGSQDKRTVFLHTILPMLEKVKMHPSLVTGTRESELATTRWQSRDYHDIIAECSKISLDTFESSLPEEVPSGFTAANLGSNQHHSYYNYSVGTDVKLEDVIQVPSSGLLSEAIGASELNSLVQFIDEFPSTAPQTPHSVTTAGTGASSSHTHHGHGLTIKTNLPAAETAMEATPENTPVKDKDRSHFKLPPPNTPAAIQLFGPPREEFTLKQYSYDRLTDKPAPQTPPATPYSSVPSSPLPITSSMTRRDSIFDTQTSAAMPLPLANFRREPLMLQRLQKVQLEQQAAQAQLLQQQEQQLDTTSSTSTSSPQIHPSNQQQSSIAQPTDVTRRIAVVAPHTPEEPASTVNKDSKDIPPSQEDGKTSGATTFGTTGGGLLTPVPGQSSLSSSVPGPGLIDPDLSRIALDEEAAASENCVGSGGRGPTCPSGGLHMADTEAMMAFAQQVKSRLRYHSHCLAGPEFNSSLGPSPGTSPSSTASTLVDGINAKGRNMKRSMSCSDIKKPLTVIDDKDWSGTKRPSKLPELSEAGGGSEDSKDVNNDEQSLGASNSTEQKEPEPELEEGHPYEHLFQRILPGVLPLESRTLPSPHHILDLCLVQAAKADLVARSKSDEILVLKGQIELLHSQLLFERHRREAHALRNRRLAGKCRKAIAVEEQNNTMAQKIHNLEKEIASLKQEVTIQRNLGLAKERELRNTVDEMERKLESCKKDVAELTKEKSQMETKLTRLSEEFKALHKESDQKKADYFSLENEVKNCQKYIERNKELKTAYEARLKDILMLGELLRKYKEIVAVPSEFKLILEQMEDYRLTAEDEVRNLKTSLENAKSQQEAANGRILDLEKNVKKREGIIELQRKDAQDKEQEYQTRILALETKLETVKSTNQRLELDILNLQHQICLKSAGVRPTRGRIASASSPSNNGEVSPAGNSNHSDVDSAASASGFQMSPERTHFIFGSPQFDHPSDEMKDLLSVLDKDQPQQPICGAGGGIGAVALPCLPNSGGSGRRRNSSPLTYARFGGDIGFRS